jgi:hypothetical protein
MPKSYTQITSLQNEFVVCRTLGHSWDDNPNGEVDSDLFKAATGVLLLRCTRCTTERFDYIGNDMQVFQRYYRYPLDYKTIPGEATRPAMRSELFRRSLLIKSARKRRNGR